MANEKDDFLDDLNLDDVDFDSLLDEDTRAPTDKDKKAAPASSDAASSADEGATEEEDIASFLEDDAADEGTDLLSDDELAQSSNPSDAAVDDGAVDDGAVDDGGVDDGGGVEELTEDDLLFDDDDAIKDLLGDAENGAAGSAADRGAADRGAADRRAEVSVDDLLGDADDADDVDSDADDGAVDDLLGEAVEDAAASDLLGDDDAELAGDDAVQGDDDFLADDDIADDAVAAVSAVAAASAASEDGDDAKSSKKGKKSFGKGSRPGLRTKSKGKSAEKSSRKIKPVPVPSGPIKGALRFICSECYAEFHLPSSFSSDALTCPECLHVGKRPNEDFLRTVNMHKSGEKKSLAVATMVGILLFAVLGFLVYLRSPFCTMDVVSEADQFKTWTLGLLAGGGVLAIVFLWLLTRFEGNRWDVYF